MRSRLILIIFIVCFNGVSTFGFWGTLITTFIKVTDTISENSDKANSALNIGEKLGFISSKDVYEAKTNLYQVKRFKNGTVYDNAYEYLLDHDAKQSINDIRYISRELSTITDVDSMKKTEEWAKIAISDIYSSLLYTSPKLTNETIKEIEGYTTTQDKLNLDQATNQLETTIASYQTLKHDAAQTDYLEKLATTSKASFDLQATEMALKDAEKKYADETQRELNKGIVEFNKETKKNEYVSIFKLGPIHNNLINKNTLMQQKIGDHFKTYLIGFFFIIAIIWRYLEVVLSDEQKTFPIINLTFHFLGVIILFNYSEQLFSIILEICNRLSELILGTVFNSKKDILNEFLKNHPVNFEGITVLKIGELITNTILFLVYMAISLIDILLTYIRDYILLIIYFGFPLILSLSMLPLFGYKLIFKSIILFIQVASWAVFSALFFGLYSSTINNFQIVEFDNLYLGSSTILLIQSILKGIVAVVIGVFIPRISFALLGGTDMSFLPAAAATLGFGAGSVALDKNKRNSIINSVTGTTSTLKNSIDTISSHFMDQPTKFNPSHMYKKPK